MYLSFRFFFHVALLFQHTIIKNGKWKLVIKEIEDDPG